MQLIDVLKEIRPCNTNKPYIFISYSGKDKNLVWRDVLEFQRRGYNIWIDEKNLDKTQDSWRYNALPAIEDMDCELLVFYVSKYSLISEGCYLELEKTIEERTQAIHFGPVKFIAVDVEEIGDIMDFSKSVYTELRSSNLTKEQKKKHAIILDKFKKKFFNSNNEKVRIHPKNEANRKMDYFEEILASFPSSTRIFSEYDGKKISSNTEASGEITASDSRRIDVETTILPESATESKTNTFEKENIPKAEEKSNATKDSSEGETTAEVETPVKIAISEVKNCPKAKEFTSGANTSVIGTVSAGPDLYEIILMPPISKPSEKENNTHEEIIYQAMIIANQQCQDHTFVKVREVANTQIKNAIEKCAVDADTEILIGFLDTSLFNTGKNGILITSKRLYSGSLKKLGYSLDLWKIEKVIYPIQNNKYNGDIIFENNTCLTVSFSIYNDLVFSFLKSLVEIKTGIRQIPLHNSYHVTKEKIKQAIDAVNLACTTLPYTFKYPVNLNDTQMKNAIHTYAQSASISQIICMCDTSLPQNGEKGFLVTCGRLYYSALVHKDYIELDNLKEVVLRDSNIMITYNDGYKRNIFLNIYAPNIYLFLKALIMPEI